MVDKITRCVTLYTIYNFVLLDITLNTLTDYTIAVLEDSLHVLEVVHQGHGLTLAQITESSGFVKNKVFRILFTLEKHHYIERDNLGLYNIGARLLTFHNGRNHHQALLDASQDVMDWLVQETSESIFLGVVDGTDALCIAARESPQSIRLFAEVGRRVELYLGGVPKTLLAHLPYAKQQSFITRITNEIDPDVDLNQLNQTLRRIVEQGYTVVVDELDEGAHSIASPIRDHTGKVIGGMSIAGPSMRFTDEKVDHFIHLITEATESISAQLGYRAQKPLAEPTL